MKNAGVHSLRSSTAEGLYSIFRSSWSELLSVQALLIHVGVLMENFHRHEMLQRVISSLITIHECVKL